MYWSLARRRFIVICPLNSTIEDQVNILMSTEISAGVLRTFKSTIPTLLCTTNYAKTCSIESSQSEPGFEQRRPGLSPRRAQQREIPGNDVSIHDKITAIIHWDVGKHYGFPCRKKGYQHVVGNKDSFGEFTGKTFVRFQYSGWPESRA